MVSIIKNQLLKHLSKFIKGHDQFDFSALKGKGMLTNLQLNEIVLTDLLELPSWLRLKSAICNKVSFHIQWAKLKSVPILLLLDEVHVEVETCDELRATSSSQGLSSYAGAAKYNFIHKAIDGITVRVNTVHVTFHSPAFTSKVWLSEIVVESRSPDWKVVELPGTRVKDATKEHVLLFKELVWQNVRMEARSTKNDNLSPLILLMNQMKCRITLKKRIRDSCIMGSRLVVTLDPLLWILTDLQLEAAFHFIDSLAGLIQKATELTRKTKAARKLEVLPELQAQTMRTQEQSNEPVNNQINKKLAQIDVVETSYHLIATKIDLHIYDENTEGRSGYPSLLKGSSIIISLTRFLVHFYPYHPAAGDQARWPMYSESNSFLASWLKKAQDKFSSDIMDYAQKHCNCKTMPEPTSPTNFNQDHIRSFVLGQLSMLMTSCFILRLADFTIYKVSIAGTKTYANKELILPQRKREPQGKGDRERYPDDRRPILQAEFNYYYYPSDEPFPLPTPKLCVHLDPIQVNFDVPSLLWLNAFALNLQQSLLLTSAAGNDDLVSSILTFDVHIEAINTRVVFESTEEYLGQRDRPRSLQLQVGRASISNVRHTEAGFRTELGACVNTFQLASLFHHKDFPCQTTDLPLQIDSFYSLSQGLPKSTSLPSHVSSFADVREVCNAMPIGGRKELWCISLDPVSGNFFGAAAVGKEHGVTFLANLPVTLWVRMQVVPSLVVQVLTNVSSLVSLQINHYQFLFLLRLIERVEDLTNYLTADSTRILKKTTDVTVVMGVIAPKVDINLLMPSQTPGKSSSGGDMESFIPESSSLQDDNWQSSSSAVNEKTKAGEEHIRFSNSTLNDIPNANGVIKLPLAKAPPAVFNKIPSEPEIKESRGNRKSSISQYLSNDNSTATRDEVWKAFRKGVGSVMASLEMGGGHSPDDISISMSIRSDPSSDSDEMGFFGSTDEIDTAVEEGQECIDNEPTLTSPSERDSFSTSLKRHDLVSICTFKIRKVEVMMQLHGVQSLVKVEVGNVSTGECSSIPWDEFQSKFNSRHRWPESALLDPGPRQIAVRLKRDEPPTENANLPTPVNAAAHADILVQSIRLVLSVSSIAGIVDLVEDELKLAPLPAKIILEDVRLHIVDDRPASHITSIEAPPVDIVVHHLLIQRDASGLIEVAKDHLRRVDTSDAALKRLQAKNEDLHRRLAALERLTDENYQLKCCQEQMESLLHKAQNDVASLLERNRLLLDELEALRRPSYQPEKSNKR